MKARSQKSKVKSILVDEKSANFRLDIFLSNKLEISRNQVQKLIEKHLVKINDTLPKKAGQQVKTGNVITIIKKGKETSEKNTKENDKGKDGLVKSIKKLFNPEKKIKLDIIAKEKNYLIVNKPADTLTHPTLKDESNALSKEIIKKYPEIKDVGDHVKISSGDSRGKLTKIENPRPGIVHRLDKDASGLLVVARTQPMFEHLKKQFQSRTIEKKYLTLVYGKVEKEHDAISFPLTRKKDGTMAALPELEKGLPTDKGKKALTEYSVKKRFINFTLLDVKIHTGRMHQIRAHMNAIGHPVVGDKLYFQKQYKKWQHISPRLWLHSYKLGFKNLTGEYQEYKTGLPEELKKVLEEIK